MKLSQSQTELLQAINRELQKKRKIFQAQKKGTQLKFNKLLRQLINDQFEYFVVCLLSKFLHATKLIITKQIL